MSENELVQDLKKAATDKDFRPSVDMMGISRLTRTPCRPQHRAENH